MPIVNLEMKRPRPLVIEKLEEGFLVREDGMDYACSRAVAGVTTLAEVRNFVNRHFAEPRKTTRKRT